MLFFYIISGILTFFLVLPFLTVLAAQFAKNNAKPTFPEGKTLKEYDFANIITAYKNAEIAKPLVASLLRQNHQNHHVYLVADGADVSNWAGVSTWADVSTSRRRIDSGRRVDVSDRKLSRTKHSRGAPDSRCASSRNGKEATPIEKSVPDSNGDPITKRSSPRIDPEPLGLM